MCVSVCVCVCWVHCLPTYPSPQGQRLNWFNPYLAPLSRGWDGSNPHCQASMLGGTHNLSPPPEACVPGLRLLELWIAVLSQQTPEQHRKKTHHTAGSQEEYFCKSEIRLKEVLFYLCFNVFLIQVPLTRVLYIKMSSTHRNTGLLIKLKLIFFNKLV